MSLRSLSVARRALLRTPLMVMVLLTAMLCILASLALIVENRKQTVAAAERENAHIARLVGFHVSHLINTGIRLLDGVAESVEEQGVRVFESPEGLQRLARRVRGLPELQSLQLLDQEGRLRVGTSLPFPPPEVSYADRESFELHRKGRDLVFGEQLMSRTHGRSGTTISRALRNKRGEFLGVVSITMESSHFARLFRLPPGRNAQEITVLRDDGAIFVRFPEVEQGLRVPHSEVFKHAARSPSGVFEAKSAIDRLPRLFAYERLREYPLIVVASQNRNQVMEPWRQYAELILLGLVLAMVLLGAASRFAFRSAAETESLQAELQRLAHTDPLTGLSNRRHFMELAEQAYSRAIRYASPLAVLAIDIDHFKRVNDTHGHASGDVVLRGLAALFKRELRDIDIVGRLGGEEFAVVLEHTDARQAIEIAERLRLRVETSGAALPRDVHLDYTVSIGAALLSDPGGSLESLLVSADEALYRAKRAGRNRVEVFAEPPMNAASA